MQTDPLITSSSGEPARVTLGSDGPEPAHPAGRRPITDAELERSHSIFSRLAAAYDGKVVGQVRLRTSLLVTMLAEGHILLESVPGLAKTTAASTLANSVNASFARIQCTPDLLPSDIIGTQVYDPNTATFSTRLGPVHANFVLLDEINLAVTVEAQGDRLMGDNVRDVTDTEELEGLARYRIALDIVDAATCVTDGADSPGYRLAETRQRLEEKLGADQNMQNEAVTDDPDDDDENGEQTDENQTLQDRIAERNERAEAEHQDASDINPNANQEPRDPNW